MCELSVSCRQFTLSKHPGQRGLLVCLGAWLTSASDAVAGGALEQQILRLRGEERRLTGSWALVGTLMDALSGILREPLW